MMSRHNEFSKQYTLSVYVCAPNMRMICPWNEKKKSRKEWNERKILLFVWLFERICVSDLCSDPLTSMKFIRFFHDNHIFHWFSFNKRYSLAHTWIHLALPYRKMYMSEMLFECRTTEENKQKTHQQNGKCERMRRWKRKSADTQNNAHTRFIRPRFQLELHC